MKRWNCDRCSSLHEGEDERVVFYLTQGDNGYYPLLRICKECYVFLGLNDNNINCKIALRKNNQLIKELYLNYSSDDTCSICKKSYDPYKEYGICIYKEKNCDVIDVIDVIDAEQVFNICNGCYREINTVIIKGSKQVNFFFDTNSYDKCLIKKEFSKDKIVYRHAFGKMHDDGETLRIVGDVYWVDFEFHHEINA